jgi:glyoxylase-like metal-dependent hydrolase (beta-lactamase superfamily II)
MEMKDAIRFGRVVFLPGPNRGKYPHCHSLYIDDEVQAVVDPAAEESALRSLAAEKPIAVVIHSHWHEDHFWFTDLFAGAALWVPAADLEPYLDLEQLLRWYGFDDPAQAAPWREIMVQQFRYRPRQPDRTYREGEIFSFGATRAEVVHTPGHTPGHSCLFFPEESLLFLGDIDLSPFGPWYGDLYSSLDDFIASVEKVRRIPARHYVSSHEQGLFAAPIGHLLDRYLAVIETREQKLRELLSEPRTREDIIARRIVYGRPREPKSFYDFAEWAILRKHLERMRRRGEVKVEEGGRWRLS